ncbi:MAG: exo-alpha-sialidase [Opitutaceae bacterium]|nr:exo-alpha-sialidase [Opitutaceae bacterium]
MPITRRLQPAVTFAVVRKRCRLRVIACLLAGLLPLAGSARAQSGPPPGVVIATSPDPDRAYIGTPAIALLPDGSYVAAHDFFGRNPELTDRTRVFGSRDRGVTWTQLAELRGQAWYSLFVHRGALYLHGTASRYGDLTIRRSTDGGRTWTEPRDGKSGRLIRGRFHGAPVPVVVHAGRIWRGVEERVNDLQWPLHFSALVVSAPEQADLLDAANWTRTNGILFDPAWYNGRRPGWLEGNVVVTPEGTLANFLRVHTEPRPEDGFASAGGARGIPRYEVGARAEISADGRTMSFDPTGGLIHLPGSQSKFTIRFDPISRRYWALIQKITLPHEGRDWKTSPIHQRNVLMLTSSADLRTWREDSIVLRWRERQMLAGSDRVAWQYLDWQFDGDDLVAVSRTSWGGQNYHNANFMTFHRVPNFRRRTMQDAPPDLAGGR